MEVRRRVWGRRGCPGVCDRKWERQERKMGKAELEVRGKIGQRRDGRGQETRGIGRKIKRGWGRYA